MKKCTYKVMTALFVLLISQWANAQQAQTTSMQKATQKPNYTSAEVLEEFEKLFGKNKGRRKNHTKGFCFEGTLLPGDPKILAYSNSELFRSESSVKGRLSHKGGKLYAADDVMAEYGMALMVKTANNQIQMMSMNTLDFFPVASPNEFFALMQAKNIGKSALKKLKQQSPTLSGFLLHHSSRSRELLSYEGQSYNSINSFYLVNDDGEKFPVRWSFVPVKKQAIVVDKSENFFYQNMQKNLKNGEIVWNWVITFANEDDDINNAAIAWSGPHEQIIAARLLVKSISTEEQGECKNLNFDPLRLAEGFQPSADPLLPARSQSYALGFAKRMTGK